VLDASPEDITLIVVDDGATDGTTAADPGAPVSLLRLPSNVGRTSALRAGVRQAGDRGVVIVDPANAGTAWELER
jgi:glycosyltransferase involved in cell wall biosynthesis